jgi:hypothetical protein
MKEPLTVKVEHWIASWIDILCAAINIITFTLYHPWWDMDYRIYTTKKRLKKHIAKRKGD